jgi:hypothetical protein
MRIILLLKITLVIQMGSSCFAAKSTHNQKLPTSPNPEAIFMSPVKGKGELKQKNSKLVSLSASPGLTSVLTIGNMPSSLPGESLHPTPINSMMRHDHF